MRLMWMCVAMLVAAGGAANLAQSPADGRVAIGLELFPRLVALEADLAEKRSADGTLAVRLVFWNDSTGAGRHANALRAKVTMIRGTRVSISVASVADLVDVASPPAAILIVEPIPARDRERLLAYARQHHRIVFSPFEGDVEQGVTAGIFIGARVMLYFNARALEMSRIQLDPMVLKLSKVHE